MRILLNSKEALKKEIEAIEDEQVLEKLQIYLLGMKAQKKIDENKAS